MQTPIVVATENGQPLFVHMLQAVQPVNNQGTYYLSGTNGSAENDPDVDEAI